MLEVVGRESVRLGDGTVRLPEYRPRPFLVGDVLNARLPREACLENGEAVNYRGRWNWRRFDIREADTCARRTKPQCVVETKGVE